LRRKDVGQLSILVFHECDERSAIGVEFEALDPTRNVELPALEIDEAITLLVAASLPAHRHAAGIVAATVSCLSFGKTLDGTALVKLPNGRRAPIGAARASSACTA